MPLPMTKEPTKIRLLVVEDSPSTRLSITIMLGFVPGLEVIGAVSSAHELLENLQLQPTLILMDLHLPDLDGLVSVKQLIAKLPKAIAVIIMSVEEYNRENALGTGAKAFLPKPFSLDQLLQTLEQLSARPVISQYSSSSPGQA